MNYVEKIKKLDDIFFKIILKEFQHLASLQTDLNLREFLIIKYLAKNEVAIMSELTSVFATVPTTMTGVINSLVDRSYVKRRRSSEDRRVVEVVLAEKGMDLYKNYQNELVNQGKIIWNDLDEKKIEEIIESFSRVDSKLNKN